MTDYVPLDWQDNVTPVDAANLDHMEAGIDTAHSELAAVDARLVTVEGRTPPAPAVPADNGKWLQASAGAMVWVAQDDVPKSLVDAKGDLIVGQADNAVARLPAGTNGHVLTADSVEALGLKWAAAAGGGGAELVFEGDWAAPTTYQDGDYVVKDGVVFVCVGGPTTTPPDVSLWGAPGIAPSSAVSYGTAFPASPVNGQEHILVDNVTAPNWQWRFRYNASSTHPHKWEFVGGMPLTAHKASNDNLALTGAALAVPNGPSLTVPRAGRYQLESALTLTGANFPAFLVNASYAYGSSTLLIGGSASTNTWTFLASSVDMVDLTAGQVLALLAWSGQAFTWGFINRSVSITPVRVS